MQTLKRREVGCILQNILEKEKQRNSSRLSKMISLCFRGVKLETKLRAGVLNSTAWSVPFP